MKLYIINHTFHYEMENLIRLFFSNDKIEVCRDEQANFISPCVITSLSNVENDFVAITATAKICDYFGSRTEKVSTNISNYDNECERVLATLIFYLLQEYTGHTPPWGILTGVRPIKLFRALTDEMGFENARSHYIEKFLVTEEKANLAIATEENEKAILDLSQDRSFSLYVSIPFCPSRCSYCSFVSQSIERAKKLIEPYVELLCTEIKSTADIVKKLGLRLETVYIGGGTPTTLEPYLLTRLLSTINNSFDMSTCREFTVEAGRPDTITEAKLKAILEGGADRISINPQTLNDDILELIGRKHTAQETIEAYQLARQVGFKHINMDLIAGLPTESYESFCNTLDQIIRLDPESITVHTLSMKKASDLTTQGMSLYKKDAENAAKMHVRCKLELSRCEYRPYYLYRQSRMVGNLENIGYAKKGYDGLYNVFVMDETHTIFGCGAGAVTKLKNPNTNYLERIFNYKYPYEYINQFEEMIKRKSAYEPFYEKIFR